MALRLGLESPVVEGMSLSESGARGFRRLTGLERAAGEAALVWSFSQGNVLAMIQAAGNEDSGLNVGGVSGEKISPRGRAAALASCSTVEESRIFWLLVTSRSGKLK